MILNLPWNKMRYKRSIIYFYLFCLTACSLSPEVNDPDTPFKPWDFDRSLLSKFSPEHSFDHRNSRSPRQVIPLADHWTFDYRPSSREDTTLVQPNFDDSQWSAVGIPHTWQTYETTGGLHPFILAASERDDSYWWQGWGYYRTTFTADTALARKKVFIEFDGVQKYAKVYLNGKLVGDHKGGFTSFHLDITDYLKLGEANQLTVMVNNNRRDAYRTPPMTAGNWNVYGGIYRDVRLVVKNKLYIPYQGSGRHEGGAFITTPKVSATTADVNIITYVKNEFSEAQPCRLVTNIYAPDGTKVRTLDREQTLEAGELVSFTQSTQIDNPLLWDTSDPHLYQVESRVELNGELQDVYGSPLGFRWFHWDYDTDDLYLNGKKINIHGFNRHQEYPWLGDAIPDWITIWDFIDLKYRLGTNFMRPAHYPNDPLVYDLADQLGIILVDEVPNIKAIDFSEEVQEQNVREMIRRDRNHPSVLFWSMGNETSDGADSRWAVEEDTTRIIHSRKAKDTGDFVEHTHQNLDMENLLRVTIHGWYTQEDVLSDVDANPPNGQHASTEVWQHQMAQVRGGSVRGVLNDNMVGWLYADHGADREYDNAPLLHINPKGWVDSYRVPKYLYFLTQVNQAAQPELFIQPHHWRQKYLGQRKNITVDSNCDSVVLFVNDKLLKMIYPAASSFRTVTVEDVLIEDATLKGVGYYGDQTTEMEVVMIDAPHLLLLTTTHTENRSES